MSPSGAIQLPLLPCLLQGTADPSGIVGSWSLGDRLLWTAGQPVLGSVWFHFQPEGQVTLSLRLLDHDEPVRARGRWWIEKDLLVVSLAGGMISSLVTVSEEVMHWAGEVLVRQSAASGLAQEQVPWAASVSLAKTPQAPENWTSAKRRLGMRQEL